LTILRKKSEEGDHKSFILQNMNYDFSTLNNQDLEELARDLLNVHFKLDFQSFKAGRDQGVDLRISTEENVNSIVVQVKHYLKSGDTKLISDLRKIELKKVKKLNPDRYIVVTSVQLSKMQKDEIKNIFSPYILTANDVIGREDLNKFLRKYKKIEKSHFKLWFSSMTILEGIFNNAVEGRTRSYLEQVSSRFPFYVVTKNLDIANKVLAREKLLLLTGLAGIGKTTLAEVLLLEKAKQGYQVYLVNTVREAEDVISCSDEKQIFYFDDFLGEVYYEILTGSNKESEIAQFVDRIKHTKNKFLVLSTRTVILEQAKSKSQKIKNSRLESGKYELILEDYNRFEKAKILYNHIYFRNLRKELIEAILEDKFYITIIEHNNYTPRIIETITDERIVGQFSNKVYKAFVTDTLENPDDIWDHSFHQQISHFDRSFLFTLFTFQRGIGAPVLERAFCCRLETEKKYFNRPINSNQFSLSVKNLLNGFIIVNIANVDEKIINYKFVNPSVSDFLLAYLNKNFAEKKTVIQSITHIEQLEIFNPEKNKLKIEKELQEIIKEKINNSDFDSIDDYKQYYFTGAKLEAIIKYCPKIEIDSSVLTLLQNLDISEPWWVRNHLLYALENIKQMPRSEAFIKQNFFKFINCLSQRIDDSDVALRIPEIFKKYGENYRDYIIADEGIVNIKKIITNLIVKKEEELYSSYKDSILEKDDTNTFIYDRLREIKTEVSEVLLPDTTIEIERKYSDDNFNDQIEVNKKNTREAATREKNTQSHYEELVYKKREETTKINEMFMFMKK
jgi:GTPase SAR1 family protein